MFTLPLIISLHHICLVADNIDRELHGRTVPQYTAAAGRSSLSRSADNHQIQNNQRQSSGDVSTVLHHYFHL